MRPMTPYEEYDLQRDREAAAHDDYMRRAYQSFESEIAQREACEAELAEAYTDLRDWRNAYRRLAAAILTEDCHCKLCKIHSDVTDELHTLMAPDIQCAEFTGLGIEDVVSHSIAKEEEFDELYNETE